MQMPSRPVRQLLLALAAGLGFALPAQAAENSADHGIAMHGDLKYAADFAHFDYVNPNAPKGGETTRAAIGGYDTFNPCI